MKQHQPAVSVKNGTWLFRSLEEKLVNILVPLVPSVIHTYHLTLFTLGWSILVFVFAFFAKTNISFLWGVVGLIILQYLSDILDGAVGRDRNSGFIKWGYYMDHLLDYFFLCSLIVGLSMVINLNLYWFLSLTIISGAFMISTFLSFGATHQFRISFFWIGPTEVRLGFILIYLSIILFGAELFSVVLPFLTISICCVLFFLVYQTQKKLWIIDKTLVSKHSKKYT